MRALLSWTDFTSSAGWRIETARGEDSAVTTLLGPETTASAPFTEALPSWVAATPPGTRIEIQLRARRKDRWSAFYRIAEWDSLAEGSARQSFDPQRDDDGRVATDTLVMSDPATAIQPRVLLFGGRGGQPELRALRVALSAPSASAPSGGRAPTRELPIPPRSQMSYPGGGGLCSPTTIAMLLAYWHARTGDARLAPFADPLAVSELVAPGVFDRVYDGHGNWGFNTAYAASHGLDAYLARFDSLAQLAPWLEAGVPLAISVAWKAGELAGAPIPSSNGHLLVLAGFDADGRAIVAEPRAERENDVRRSYDAAQIEAAWQNNSTGTVYIVHPYGWPVPDLTC